MASFSSYYDPTLLYSCQPEQRSSGGEGVGEWKVDEESKSTLVSSLAQKHKQIEHHDFWISKNPSFVSWLSAWIQHILPNDPGYPEPSCISWQNVM